MNPASSHPVSPTTPHSLRLALPVLEGRLHGHFGGCREFALVEVDPDRKVVLHTEVQPAPEHQPGAFPRWLRQQGVEVVIAGGIGHRALANFAHHGITVRAGWPDAPVEVLVAAYLNGQLTGEPDGCRHHGHHHHPEAGPHHPHGHAHPHPHPEPDPDPS